jgi:hypothetical protein
MDMDIHLHDCMVEFTWDLNSYARVQSAEMTWVQASEGMTKEFGGMFMMMHSFG